MYIISFYSYVSLDSTGKTICICNRMDLDRQRYHRDPTFTQLFVSRSARLCKYVREVVGAGFSTSFQSFTTFRELLYQLESSLPQIDEGSQRSFRPNQRVDFYRFEREFYNESRTKQINALLVWKSEKHYFILLC